MNLDFNAIPNQNIYGYDTGTENLKQTAGGTTVSEDAVISENTAKTAEGVNEGNTGNTQTQALVRALEAANIVVNEETLKMVDLMMKEGMNVDKESLQNMYRLLLKNPQVEPKQLLSMKALSIEINDLSIRQFAQYEQLNHQLTEGFQTLGEDMQVLLGRLTQNGESQTATAMLKEMNTLFADGTKELDVGNVQKLADADGLLKQMLGVLNKSAFQTNAEGNAYAKQLIAVGEFLAAYAAEGEDQQAKELLALFKELGQVSGDTSQAENLLLLKNESGDIRSILSQLQQSVQNEKVTNGRLENTLNATPEGIKEAYTKEVNQLQTEQKAALINELKTSYLQLKQVVTQLNTTGNAGGLFQNLELANANLKDVMMRFSQNLNRVLENEFTGKTKLSDEIRNFFSERLLMEPMELADENRVKDYYNALTDKMQQLSATLDKAGLNQTQLFQSSNQISENVQFMNHLNQVFQYVQLPLKMNGGGRNGELYVYSNKKNLASSEGNISALLHLDMDHIGPLDVFVELSGKSKVSTNFYVKDDEILDFIEQYLPMLNERLQSKGYQVYATASVKEESEPKSVMEHMMEKKASAVRAKLLKSTSFDMKV